MKRFNSILIANRGEIAMRVIRTARALGYRSIAIYSEADAGAPHVLAADDACLIGPGPAAESYLDMMRVLAAAKASGAEAIHPGYGFLSENADFARAVEAAGIVFIGPSANAIDLMGNKAAAKRRMIAAGVRCVPGYEDADQSDAAFQAAATGIGFPIMVKAAAGGGGRGMRLAMTADELPAAIATARSEARNAFGSDELILEKAIIAPRHVEFQVLADEHGNVLHLGERDCSVQRRHQKVIEESPCPVMTPELREAMGASATEAARSIGYRGAGTVEFLLDVDKSFYFLEMNTRLQVEHPVTELVTGLDLVEMQIAVAQGRAIELRQEDVTLKGHALEARLYAEDPDNGFLPASGRILDWSPATGEGVRIDDGITSGQVISSLYDPMLAKIIAYGATRDDAIDRLIGALRETTLFGLKTNRAFLVDILANQAFQAGTATTAFIGTALTLPETPPAIPPAASAIAAVLHYLAERGRMGAKALSPRGELLDWSSNALSSWQCRYGSAETPVPITLRAASNAPYTVRVDCDTCTVDVISRDGTAALVVVDARRVRVTWLMEDADTIHLAWGAQTWRFNNRLVASQDDNAATKEGVLVAPMHGVLVDLFVAAGDTVARGDRLAILEAMKMQHELRADVDGAIATVSAVKGDQIAAGDVILEISPAETPTD